MLYNKDWDKKTNSVADLLNKAADIIETKGHVKGVLHDRERGGYCLQGALMSAAGISDENIYAGSAWTPAIMNKDYMGAIDALDKATPLGYPASVSRYGASTNVVMWNNDHRTSKKDAVNKLREVAATLVDA